MRRNYLTLLVITCFVVFSLLIPQTKVLAATILPGEIIGMVNGLRASYGLPALIEDAILNSTTYITAQQMAANGVCAHIGGVRERVAAAGFGGGATVFATENIACSPDATMDWLMNVWGDADHMMPMVESRYTHIGAAAYTDSDGLTYYVLHAAYSAGTGSVNPPAPVDNPADTVIDTSQLVEPVFTVTPQDDGSIVHVVKYGHTLFSIATWYNVSMEEIIALNNLGSSSLLDGQKLIIRLAPTATITPTPITPTPTATRNAPLAVYWHGNLGGALLTAAVGALGAMRCAGRYRPSALALTAS